MVCAGAARCGRDVCFHVAHQHCILLSRVSCCSGSSSQLSAAPVLGVLGLSAIWTSGENLQASAEVKAYFYLPPPSVCIYPLGRFPHLAVIHLLWNMHSHA